MQHKGVSCGPLSFIHAAAAAAAACELPAWQSCRRVLWHPVDSCSHPSIRGLESRAGAHLHKKYMDTFLTYVTVTRKFVIFLLPLWKLSLFFIFFLDKQPQWHLIVRRMAMCMLALCLCCA